MINEYIKHLINLVDCERKSQIKLMVDEIKNLSAEERQKEGRTVIDLRGRFVKKELKMAIAKFISLDKIETEINVGDMVLISTGDPLKNNISGTVTEKRTRSIFVAFSGRIPDWAFGDYLRMDLYVNDITFSRMENNLKHLNSYGKNALNVSISKSNVKKDKKIKKVKYLDDSLNQFQRTAISKSLSCEDFFLIHGPFGTGKTKTLTELVIREVKNKHKVLVTAESNAAVDNLVERLSPSKLDIVRLGHPQKVSEESMKHTLIKRVETHDLYKNIEKTKQDLDELYEKLSNELRPTRFNRNGLTDMNIINHASKNKGTPEISVKDMKSMAEWIRLSSLIKRKNHVIRKTEEKIVEDLIQKSEVILATNSSAALEEIENIKFDVAVIDEASQTTIPSVLIPIAKAHRFILAGDHKQLPPTVLSDDAKELQITLFEKLISLYPNKKQLLNVQFRMNKLLMEFPNSEFYNGELLCDENVKDITIDVRRKKLDLDSPLVFIDTSNSDKNYERKLKYSKSFVNYFESNLALKISNEYLKLGISSKDMGIISPYADQVNIMKNRTDVEVKSIDGFQGREKDIIIISLVRSNKWGNIGFLRDLRRLNVAITRAKRKLIIIANKETIKHDDVYKRLVDFCKDRNLIVDVGN